MSARCHFDDSLPRLVRLLVDSLGPERTAAGVVLRDVTGRLRFFAREPVAAEAIQALEARAVEQLGSYVQSGRVVVSPDDPGAPAVLADEAALAVDVSFSDDVPAAAIRLVDRRIVGADWLRAPEPSPAGGARATRVVFASLKGGVGRSTALTVVAADQARRGRNVLVVDLDLEAPGIGTLLLSEDRMPAYGAIDYLVERNLGSVDPAVVDDLVGTSALTRGKGLVQVVPAVGLRTRAAPENYLAKLSRAMTEALEGERGPVSVTGKLQELLTVLESRQRYDLVLVDARAGLAELTAGPLLALDADILLFGTDQAQTRQDLAFLLAHLGRLTRSTDSAYWARIKMVHAKASKSARIAPFRNELWELFTSYLYVEALELDAFNYDEHDDSAPHYPLVIPLETAFADWDPVRDPDQLGEDFYRPTFGKLLMYVDDVLAAEQRDGAD